MVMQSTKFYSIFCLFQLKYPSVQLRQERMHVRILRDTHCAHTHTHICIHILQQSLPLSHYQSFLSWTVLLKHVSYPVNFCSSGRGGVCEGEIERGKERGVGGIQEGREVEEEEEKTERGGGKERQRT